MHTYNLWKEWDRNQQLDFVVHEYLEVFREIMHSAFVMKREQQRVFPEKSGELMQWNFPKMHAPDDKAAEIVAFASRIVAFAAHRHQHVRSGAQAKY